MSYNWICVATSIEIQDVNSCNTRIISVLLLLHIAILYLVQKHCYEEEVETKSHHSLQSYFVFVDSPSCQWPDSMS